MSKKYLKPLYFLSLLIAFLCSLCFLQRNSTHQKYHKLCQQLLTQTYEKDTLSMHFAFENPAQFGLDESRVSFPCYQKETYLKDAEKTEEILKQLSQIDSAKLSKNNQETLSILSSYLSQRAKGTSYLYFEQPLSPTSGIHIQLPVLLAEYAITSEKDISTYLSLLKQLPVYFNSLLAYEQDKANAGLFFSLTDCKQVISQCNQLSGPKGKQLFESCFLGQLISIYDTGTGKYTDYQKEHAIIFEQYVAPAYQNLAEGLKKLIPLTNPQLGLCQYPKGAKYYEYYLSSIIGTDKDCHEIQTLLQKRYRSLYKEFCSLKKTYSPLALDKPCTKPDLDAYLQALTKSFRQQFGSLGKTQPVSLKKIPDALTDYTAPAYYFLPRLKICSPGHINQIESTIYYGKQADDNPALLFTTLAHEGYPGHMFQNLFFLNTKGISQDNILRFRLDFPGYQEGWAMYTELLAYEKASDFLQLDPTYCQLLRLSREIQICVLCYLDTKIHADGANLADTAKTLTAIGIKDPKAIQDTYSYLINEPGTYLKYYVGYLELLSCKEAFQKHCTQKNIPYRDIDFHTFFLSHGPDTFPRIRESIQTLP